LWQKRIEAGEDCRRLLGQERLKDSKTHDQVACFALALLLGATLGVREEQGRFALMLRFAILAAFLSMMTQCWVTQGF